MSRIKANVKTAKRAALNTTIDEDVLNGFKAYCKELGLPMNYILTAAMRGLISEDLVIKIGKNNQLEIDEKDSKE